MTGDVSAEDLGQVSSNNDLFLYIDLKVYSALICTAFIALNILLCQQAVDCINVMQCIATELVTTGD